MKRVLSSFYLKSKDSVKSLVRIDIIGKDFQTMKEGTTIDKFEKLIKVSKKNSFNNKEFWDSKYRQNEKPLDWYISFEEFYKKLGEYLKVDHHILNVGAGSSEISERLYDTGFKRIVNIDYSKEVVCAMTKRYKMLQCHIPYYEMDMRKLQFEENVFDVVLDLGGSDCLLCSRNPLSDYQAFTEQVFKVLRENGVIYKNNLIQKP